MSTNQKMLLLCSKALSSYQPDLKGIDEHAECFLESNDCLVRFNNTS